MKCNLVLLCKQQLQVNLLSNFHAFSADQCEDSKRVDQNVLDIFLSAVKHSTFCFRKYSRLSFLRD